MTDGKTMDGNLPMTQICVMAEDNCEAVLQTPVPGVSHPPARGILLLPCFGQVAGFC